MLAVRNIESGYGPLRVLKGLSLHVSPGEIVTIIGANGAGKTTLLRTLCGLTPAFAGEILFEGQTITSMPTERIVELGCALVPEGRQLFAPLSVRENLLLGAYSRMKRGRARRDVTRDIDAVLARFPQLKTRLKQPAGTLSGGEQQMLAVGRALMTKPRLMMMDEPSMGLAPMMVKQILAAVSELRASGVTVLLVEQNARAALAVADRGYVLETGHVLLEGSADDLMHSQDVQRAYLGRDFRTIAE